MTIRKLNASRRLWELKKEMSDKFEYSFGHNLSDEDRERNYQEYLKLREQYLTEYQKHGCGGTK